MHSLQVTQRQMNIILHLQRFYSRQPLRLHEETGADIKFINLSGGVGIPYTSG